MKSILLGLSALLALTACMTTTGNVVPTGKDTYVVIASGVSGPFSKNELQAALERANKFCASKGQTATVSGTDNQGVPGWSQIRSTVNFSCS